MCLFKIWSKSKPVPCESVLVEEVMSPEERAAIRDKRVAYYAAHEHPIDQLIRTRRAFRNEDDVVFISKSHWE